MDSQQWPSEARPNLLPQAEQVVSANKPSMASSIRVWLRADIESARHGRDNHRNQVARLSHYQITVSNEKALCPGSPVQVRRDVGRNPVSIARKG